MTVPPARNEKMVSSFGLIFMAILTGCYSAALVGKFTILLLYSIIKAAKIIFDFIACIKKICIEISVNKYSPHWLMKLQIYDQAVEYIAYKMSQV